MTSVILCSSARSRILPRLFMTKAIWTKPAGYWNFPSVQILLATIYREKGETEKIAGLIPVAKELNSSLSKHIVAALEEFLPQ